MDFLKDLGMMALGSRLKRLLERLNKDVARYYRWREIDFQPHWFSTLYLLSRQSPMTITGIAENLHYTHPAVHKLAGQMIRAGLAKSSPGRKDRRERHISLTGKGRAMIATLTPAWTDIGNVMSKTIGESGYDLMGALDGLEERLDQKGLFRRLAEDSSSRFPDETEILDYRPAFKKNFRTLNEEWLTGRFQVEMHDKEILSDPYGKIIKAGGTIFFARRKGKIIGTCALVKHPGSVWELAKLAVTEQARGRHIGTKLVRAAIRKAGDSGARRLCLETSPTDTRAIGFFERLGFEKTETARLPARYRRLRLAMELDLSNPLAIRGNHDNRPQEDHDEIR